MALVASCRLTLSAKTSCEAFEAPMKSKAMVLCVTSLYDMLSGIGLVVFAQEVMWRAPSPVALQLSRILGVTLFCFGYVVWIMRNEKRRTDSLLFVCGTVHFFVATQTAQTLGLVWHCMFAVLNIAAMLSGPVGPGDGFETPDINSES